MTVSTNLFVKVVLIVIAAVFAFFLFRSATDADLRPWLAAGVVALGFGSIILP